MKKRFNVVVSLLLILLLVLPYSNFAHAATTDGDGVKHITIFHTNDMHGRLVSKSDVVGINYIAAMKKSVPDSLLIDAGDATQGLPFANISKGADVIKLMNEAGYDGMTLGNHEFDFGLDQAISNVKLAKFTMVTANTYYNGNLLLKDMQPGNNGADFIKTVDGVKIGFFGVTTQETAYKTNPNNIKGVTFADPIETSKNEVAKLKNDGAQVIVGIMHIGNDSSSDPTSEKIAQSVSGINVILDGHSHTKENKVVNNTLIAQTGSYNSNVGKVDITVTNNTVTEATESLINPAKAMSDFTPDKAVTALVNQISDSQKSFSQTIVGRTKTALWGGTVNATSVARLGETNLGDIIADSMIFGAQSQVKGTKFEGLPIIALENGGGVRDTIQTGYINKEQVIGVLPFGNILSLKVVTPKILFETLENGVSKIGVDPKTGIVSGADGRFPQIAGMKFEYDSSQPASNTDPSKGALVTGSRVQKITLDNGTILDRNDDKTEIVLASNDFEIAGGDGYSMLKSLKNIGEGDALDVLFEKYIKKLTKDGNGVFAIPSSQNRIKAITTYQYQPYSATVTVKNGTDLVSGKSVSYSIDGQTPVAVLTDANGVLTITNIPSGPHSVMVTVDNLVADVFVNNLISGFTNVTANLANVDAKMAEAVSKIIAALPESVTINDGETIKAARAAYNDLTDAQKALVTNYSKIQDSEEALANLNAVDDVKKLIGKLPAKVTLQNAQQVAEARAAYNKLTNDQKVFVTNYNHLVAAEKALADLKKVASVKLNVTSTTVKTKATIKLVATVSPSTAANKNVIWTSSNPAVATVDAKGQVVTKKAGTAIITVKTITGNKTAKCTITVVEPVKSVKLSKAKLTLKVGQKSTLKAMINPSNATNKKVVWTSSNKAIATVDANGKIIGKKRGTVKITVKTVDSGKTAVCTVQVK
ncbi:5'-nucleotidase C-terminal domain-containing protein [Bacillus sp. RG28]|uniref:5'-nucleotidase C-terminal domain-containing protein n=1 Tax=Gottfriedia endophytica TaxID=2820819 RepID=A0A940NGA8_9BACI|nr:Ig-like domain-containing protein [Gottfriedia endophytica]MBP0723685.1 5'-nucleotidase C-terminal domain-containing protein [Gottfriedia endophytica]